MPNRKKRYFERNKRLPIKGFNESTDFRLLKEWAGWEIGYTAQLTEYRGIVFRSKSEAIVARTFDLAKVPWIYEPEMFKEQNWSPDFLIELNEGFRCVIEYKPRLPTGTYLHGLAHRFHCLQDRHNNLLTMLLVGNPFHDAKPIGYFYRDGKQAFVMEFDTFNQGWSKARAFRFDLPSDLPQWQNPPHFDR